MPHALLADIFSCSDGYIGLVVTSDTKASWVTTSRPTQTWEWVDGSNPEWTMWEGNGYTGEPDEGTGYECAYSVNGKWRATACTATKRHLCSVPALRE